MTDKDTSAPMPLEGGQIKPGLYPFLNMDGDVPTRFHLRVDPDGGGILLANASEAANLSPVGVLMAYAVLSGAPEAQVTREIRAKFWGGSASLIQQDWAAVKALLDDLSAPQARFPVTDFGAEIGSADARRLAAPYRADVTQGAPEQVEPIIRKLWEVSVPQVTFHGVPDRDPRELVRLVEIAEDIGMIAGLRTVASWVPEDILKQVAFAGLDYLALPFASCDPVEQGEMVGSPGDLDSVTRAWGLCHEWELCPVAQIPLTDRTMDELEQIIECVADNGVGDMWFFAVACLDHEDFEDAAGALPARYLPQLAAAVYEDSEQFGYRFVWQPPVKMDLNKSLPEHIIAGPRTSGDVAIRVEPDGSVLPPRGRRDCAGNILTQPWAQIWAGECFTRYRESVEEPTPSPACPEVPICQVWPPEDPTGWSDDAQEGDV